MGREEKGMMVGGEQQPHFFWSNMNTEDEPLKCGSGLW